MLGEKSCPDKQEPVNFTRSWKFPYDFMRTGSVLIQPELFKATLFYVPVPRASCRTGVSLLYGCNTLNRAGFMTFPAIITAREIS